MYMEVYVDSLFLINFVMNLYLLILVNRSTYNTANAGRLLLGAAAGAFAWLLSFPDWGPIALRVLISALAGTGMMIGIAFRVCSLGALYRILQKLLLYSFLLGGGVLFLRGRVPCFKENQVGIFAVMGAGGLIFMLAANANGRKKEMGQCQVTLVTETGGMINAVRTFGLIDSGNGLVEPISGKPVSVIDKRLYEALWKEEPLWWRAVPYHSIGRKRGILRAYAVSELWLELEGVTKKCREVYVAVSPEPLLGKEGAEEQSGLGMIVNPVLLEKNEKKRAKEKSKRKCKRKSKRQR